jgi:hypothetical protein
MRNGQGNRRGRGRGRGGPPGPHRIEQGNTHRNDARIRGNAHQLLEKYKNLARDAAAAGDRIMAEYYMQHADHYFRVLAELRPKDDHRPRPQNYSDSYQDDGDDAVEGVGNVDINNPQSFAAQAAVQSFGADGPPVPQQPSASDGDEDGDEGDDDDAPPPVAKAAAPAAAAASDDEAEGEGDDEEEPRRRRGRRGRSIRSRRREDAPAPETTDA